MSNINNDMVTDLKEFQKKQEFKEKHIKEIDATVWAYCKNYNKSVDNLRDFISNMEDSLLNEMWQDRLERSKKAKEAHKKKNAGAPQQHNEGKQQNKNKQQSNNNQQKFQR